jgi:hypothetical protein
MAVRWSSAAVAAVALFTSVAAAEAFDDAKYPDFSGQWRAIRLGVGGQPAFDPTKAWGRAQQAPLTPEYKAVFEASLAEQAKGGQGNWYSGARCLPPGMPATMTVYSEMEIVVLPEITYLLFNHNLPTERRVYTDERGWPAEVDLTYQGYSIGRWIDEDQDGRYDVLEIETRYFKGPRALDPTGIPVHTDNQSIVKERIFLDKSNPNLLYDEIALIDHALLRPWTVLKSYRRTPARDAIWTEQNCPAVTANVLIHNDLYYLSADHELMPTRKDQAPPDFRYFHQN